MADQQTELVIAYFNSWDDADEAAKSLKSWDKANDDIKLGAIGVMYQNDNGKIKTKKYGQHNTGSGAKIGLLLGVMAAILPAVALVGGVVGGAIGGGILGSFSRKGLGLTDEEIARIKEQVSSGKAALAVLASPEEVDAVTAELGALGGTPETFNAPSDEIHQVAQDVNAAAPDEIEAELAAPAAAVAATSVMAADTAAPAEAETFAPAAAMAASAEADTAAPTVANESEATLADSSNGAQTVVITTVHYEGDEYVQIRNDSAAAVDLAGWTLLDKSDEKASMTFPDGTQLQPGSTVKVFTKPGHNLSFNSKHPIWNNQGDEAVLRNPEGEDVSTFSYGRN